MLRWATIICAISGLIAANGMHATVQRLTDQGGPQNVQHAHIHYHDGHAHMHWHSHPQLKDHSQPDTDGDHHDEMNTQDHGALPPCPPLVRINRGRDTTEQLQVLCQTCGAVSELDPPPLPPPKPPPRFVDDDSNLRLLRTVILLT